MPPEVTGPRFPPLPPPSTSGAPASPATPVAPGSPVDSGPIPLEADLERLPPVPPRRHPKHQARRERRLAARNGRDLRPTRRRWSWVFAVIAVAIAVTVGGIIVRNRRSSQAASITDPQQVQLLHSGAVPPPLRADCTGVRALPPGATAAIRCTPAEGASQVTYSQYPTADALAQAFEQRIAATGVTRSAPDDCAEVVDVEHPYVTVQSMSGRVACFHERARSILVWTMTGVSTLGVAERDDRQDQQLYDWWNVGYRVRLDTNVGPTTLTPEQSDLLLHVPQSVRATCQTAELLQNATASVACSSGTTDVFYTSYPDVDTMNAVYEAHRAATAVPVDSGLAAPGGCPGEAPYRVGSPDEGRILCYSEEGSARATWTDTQFSILAEAIRGDDQFALLTTLVDRLGPS